MDKNVIKLIEDIEQQKTNQMAIEFLDSRS